MAKKDVPAVGYARRSTDMQERSIPDQQAYVARWAKEHGYRILRWYTDDAISGTSTKGRADFDRLIRDAEAKASRDFDMVLCYDLSRFSRGGTNETGYYLHRLHMAGVEAIFCAEGIPEGEEGELLQGVKSWQARQYSVKLSRDCIRGTISHIMEKQCAPGGRPPFGYDKQHCTGSGQVLRTFRWLADGRKQELGPDGNLVRILDAGESMKKAKSDTVRYVPSAPERVAIIQRIFEQSVAGYGYHYIAARLNDEAVASSLGTPWNASQIKRVLANPAYRGALAWNKRTQGKLNGVARDGTLRPKRGYFAGLNAKDDWYVIEDAHEPLVSPETFAEANRQVAQRRDEGGLAKTVNRSLLSGLIQCMHCGHNFLQHKVWSKSGRKPVRYRYYVDGGYNRGGKSVCTASRIPADGLDSFVVRMVRDVLLGHHDDVEQAIETFVDSALTGRNTDHADDRRKLEKDLDAVNRRIKTTVTMLADPQFDGLDELKTTLADLNRRRDALQAKLDHQPTEVMAYTEADLRAWASDRFGQFEHITTAGGASLATRQLVHAYVDRIEVEPYQRRGVLYLPGDALGCFEKDLCTRATLGEPKGGIRMKGEA